jgi:hypothetical protein
MNVNVPAYTDAPMYTFNVGFYQKMMNTRKD